MPHSNWFVQAPVLRLLSHCGCGLMKYSPGGNWFAAVDSNGQDIVIYETIHMEQRGVLDGHLSNITDLCWSEDGIRLASVSDQDIYLWSMDSMEK